MKKIIHYISTIIIALVISSSADAQIASFIRYSVENGMAQSQVQTIAQDNYGKVWVGTINGVSVYNGVEFVNYNKKDGLSENWITSSTSDINGDLWFGHLGGSITKYSVESGVFEKIDAQKFNEFQSITTFLALDSNHILFGTNGSGLFQLNIQNRKIEKIKVSTSEKSRFITKLYLDVKNNIWIGTEEDGLYIFNASHLKDESKNIENITDIEGLTANSIKAISEFGDEIWVGTKSNGLNRINTSKIDELLNGKTKSVEVKQFTTDDGLISNKVSALLTDDKGDLWVGYEDKGLEKFSFINNKLISKIYGVAQGLSFYSINTLFLDREFTVWIGTNVGLNQFISDYFLLYDESVGIYDNLIWSITPDNKGNIWLGTNDGISIMKNADSKFNDDNVAVNNIVVENITGAITAMTIDDENTIWIATSSGRLFKKKQNGNFMQINIDKAFQDVIFTLASDKENNIWLGTRAGVGKINKNTNRLSFYGFDDGLGISNIRKIICASDSSVYFGGLGGLRKWDGENFEKININPDNDESVVVLSITEDLDGKIWFGAYAIGLFVYDGKNIQQFNKENGMTSETPYALTTDNENNIWIGTTFGVEEYNQSANRFSHYSRSEGFLGVEVNPNSICKDQSGNIWFGTILGAVKYNPTSDAYNEVAPLVQINSLQINNEASEFPFNGQFSPQENTLTFDYLGVSLNNSNKVRYAIMLEGLEKSWTETKLSQAFYSNLDPGNYVFKVKAYNADDVESAVITYPFNIKVPFYDSYWFYGIQVFIIIIMLFAAVFYGRKTGGSRTATVLATIALIITFEYGVNYTEDYLEDKIGQVVFIKVALNAILGLLLFPVETFVKKLIVKDNPDIKKELETE